MMNQLLTQHWLNGAKQVSTPIWHDKGATRNVAFLDVNWTNLGDG